MLARHTKLLRALAALTAIATLAAVGASSASASNTFEPTWLDGPKFQAQGFVLPDGRKVMPPDLQFEANWRMNTGNALEYAASSPDHYMVFRICRKPGGTSTIPNCLPSGSPLNATWSAGCATVAPVTDQTSANPWGEWTYTLGTSACLATAAPGGGFTGLELDLSAGGNVATDFTKRQERLELKGLPAGEYSWNAVAVDLGFTSATNSYSQQYPNVPDMRFVVADSAGGSGNDQLTGGSGDDVSLGGAGNDTITGGGGDDTSSGGEGDDSLDGGDGDDELYGEEGDDTLDGGVGVDTLSGGEGADTLSGGDGGDDLDGDAGNDDLDGDSGNDNLNGGDGDDDLDGGADDDQLFGESGSDLLAGGTESDDLFGGAGADRMFGGTGSDDLYGGSGNDSANGGTGNDRIFGGAGNDTLNGGAGRDRIVGGTGNDTINSGRGNDYIYGGKGRDRINAGAGRDRINVHDRRAASGTASAAAKRKTRDRVRCGRGYDIVYADRTDRVSSDCEKVIRAGRRRFGR